MDTGAKTVSGPAIVTTVNHGRGPLAKIAASIRASYRSKAW